MELKNYGTTAKYAKYNNNNNLISSSMFDIVILIVTLPFISVFFCAYRKHMRLVLHSVSMETTHLQALKINTAFTDYIYCMQCNYVYITGNTYVY